jgi:multiple sugar transport system ATP-binding protein
VASVVLQDVTKVFRGAKGEAIHAVEQVSLTVRDKQFLVLVGPSGCGKTTLLRLIAGLEEPGEGTILLDGFRVNGVPAKERGVAMVFQTPALYPHLSVFENMGFGLRLRHRPKAEIRERVVETAEILGLSSCLERKPQTLSGGQRQRVALGRALVRQPAVLLLDEPLSNLDPALRGQLRAEITSLHARLAITTIYVTHDQVEAMVLGQQMAVMHRGSIRQVAEPLTVYQHPANLFVAGFIGSPPMNLLRGILSRQNHKLIFQEQTPNQARHELQFCLELTDSLAWRLREYVDKEVVLGIRAEHLRCDESTADPISKSAGLATVVEVQSLGFETLVYLATASHRPVVRMPGNRSFRINQTLKLGADLSCANFFEAEAGVAIMS